MGKCCKNNGIGLSGEKNKKHGERYRKTFDKGVKNRLYSGYDISLDFRRGFRKAGDWAFGKSRKADYNIINNYIYWEV